MEREMKEIYQEAHGKVNLGLEILGRRANGYHDVDMILQSVQLKDIVHIKESDTLGISLSTNHPLMPIDERNIAYKAAQLILDEYQLDKKVHIHIEKHIPMEAGMAGGSADAAAVLRGINELYHLNLDLPILAKLGLKLGADVPFCVYEGCARARGIGEELSFIPSLKALPMLIIKPKVGMSTKDVYQSLSLDFQHPISIESIEKSLWNQDISTLAYHLENRLEDVVFKMYPHLQGYKEYLKEQGAIASVMSGSGSTIFGIFEKEETIDHIQEMLSQDEAIESMYLTYSYPKDERIKSWKKSY